MDSREELKKLLEVTLDSPGHTDAFLIRIAVPQQEDFNLLVSVANELGIRRGIGNKEMSNELWDVYQRDTVISLTNYGHQSRSWLDDNGDATHTLIEGKVLANRHSGEIEVGPSGIIRKPSFMGHTHYQVTDVLYRMLEDYDESVPRISVPTQDDYDILMRALWEVGATWITGARPMSGDLWYYYKEDTKIRLHKTSDGKVLLSYGESDHPDEKLYYMEDGKLFPTKGEDKMGPETVEVGDKVGYSAIVQEDSIQLSTGEGTILYLDNSKIVIMGDGEDDKAETYMLGAVETTRCTLSSALFTSAGLTSIALEVLDGFCEDV